MMMFFSFVIFNLMLFLSHSNEVNGVRIDYERRQKSDEDSSDSEQKNGLSNKQSDNVIKKADLEELLRLKNDYVVKNYIEEYETHLALHFTPDWTQVNRFTSPARQSIEIRREKWLFIFENMADTALVKRLDAELEKAGINRTTFCNDIAEVYFALSDNTLILDKTRKLSKNENPLVSTRSPTQEKSILAFMNSIATDKTNLNENEETVQLPKSLYIDLMRKDAHALIIKQHHDEKIQRLKNAFRKKIQRARDDNEFVDSELSSY